MHNPRSHQAAAVSFLDWLGLLWTLAVLVAYLRSAAAGLGL